MLRKTLIIVLSLLQVLMIAPFLLIGPFAHHIKWRGWGLLAYLPFFWLLASCAGLMDFSPKVALLVGGVGLLAGGTGCCYWGRKWNQDSGLHALYEVALEKWGILYICMGIFFTTGAVIGGIRQGWFE